MRSTTRSLWIGARVVVAEVALRQRVDVRPGLVAADLADDPAADLGVAVRVGGVPDRDGDLGVLLDRLVLGAVDLGVHQQLVVVGVDPHEVAGDLAVGQLDRDRGEVLARAGEVADGGFEHAPRVVPSPGACSAHTSWGALRRRTRTRHPPRSTRIGRAPAGSCRRRCRCSAASARARRRRPEPARRVAAATAGSGRAGSCSLSCSAW